MVRRQHNIEFDGLVLSNYRVIRTIGSFVKDMRRRGFHYQIDIIQPQSLHPNVAERSNENSRAID